MQGIRDFFFLFLFFNTKEYILCDSMEVACSFLEEEKEQKGTSCSVFLFQTAMIVKERGKKSLREIKAGRNGLRALH